MKKTALFTSLFCFCMLTSFASIQTHEDPIPEGDTKTSTCAPTKKSDKVDKENKIYYSSIAGESLYIETVDKHMRPLSCLLSINNENKHHFLAEDGLVALDKNTKIKAIHVFHDSKVYDFVPEDTDHNKLTLVLNTKNQKFDLYEDRARKIKNDSYLNPRVKKKMVSCGLGNDVNLLVSY